MECCVLPKPSRHRKCPRGSALRCRHLPQGRDAAGCIENQISQYRRQPRYQWPSPGQQWALSLPSLQIYSSSEQTRGICREVVWLGRRVPFFGWFMPLFFVCFLTWRTYRPGVNETGPSPKHIKKRKGKKKRHCTGGPLR